MYSNISCRRRIKLSRRSKTLLEFERGKPLKSVADKIKFARLSSDKLQREVAESLGIDRSTYINYENGHIREEYMNIEILQKISLFCGFEYDFCFNEYHRFIYNDAGKQIKDYRKIHNLTQKQLAEILDVSTTGVKRWEYGKAYPRLKNFKTFISLVEKNNMKEQESVYFNF